MDEPKVVIRSSIDMPFNVDEADYPFWWLQLKLKWDTHYYKPDRLQALIEKLETSFGRLDIRSHCRK